MDSEQREKVVRRLKSIEGHIRGIERMVEEDTYCIDVLKQTHAVQKAMDRVNSMIMQNHLQHCVIMAIQGDDAAQRQKVIGEIVEVFDMSNKVGS
ncbi:MAG: metal-sensitive transcriptional regulator [Chloroflexi bacterium]|nr:metal-sensitive transcriptional regulator [Chloroflexota bacterium]